MGPAGALAGRTVHYHWHMTKWHTAVMVKELLEVARRKVGTEERHLGEDATQLAEEWGYCASSAAAVGGPGQIAGSALVAVVAVEDGLAVDVEEVPSAS